MDGERRHAGRSTLAGRAVTTTSPNAPLTLLDVCGETGYLLCVDTDSVRARVHRPGQAAAGARRSRPGIALAENHCPEALIALNPSTDDAIDVEGCDRSLSFGPAVRVEPAALLIGDADPPRRRGAPVQTGPGKPARARFVPGNIADGAATRTDPPECHLHQPVAKKVLTSLHAIGPPVVSGGIAGVEQCREGEVHELVMLHKGLQTNARTYHEHESLPKRNVIDSF